MRPVTDIQRTDRPFEGGHRHRVPAGDQPAAIEELARRIQGEGEPTHSPARSATGTGKTATVGLAHRASCSAPPWSSSPTRRWPRSSTRSSRAYSPATRSNISSATTTTTSPRPTSRRPTPTSRRTPRSTRRSSGSGTRPPRAAHPPRRRSSWRPCRASTAWAPRRSTSTAWSTARSRHGGSTGRACCAGSWSMQYTRNDVAFTRGTFRVRGDTVESAGLRGARRPDRIVRRRHRAAHDTAPDHRRNAGGRATDVYVFPASHYVAGPRADARAIAGIQAELEERLAELEGPGKLLEAQRLRMRTTYDMEMLEQMGTCAGVENYSPPLRRARPGSPPNTCSTTSPKTSWWSSTSRTSPCRRSAACTRGTRHGNAPWWNTASGSPRRWTTGR